MDSYDHWAAARANRRRNEEVHIGFGRSINPKSNELVSGYVRTESTNPNDGIQIETLNFYVKENSNNHKTEKYELVQDHKLPVLRRSTTFFMAFTTKDRQTDFVNKDVVTLILEFGNSGDMLDGTKTIIPLDLYKKNLTKEPEFWDAIVYRTQGNNVILEVKVPCRAPVGIWKCKLETSFKRGRANTYLNGGSYTNEADEPRKSIYYHPEPIYIIFNPYDRGKCL